MEFVCCFILTQKWGIFKACLQGRYDEIILPVYAACG